MTPDHRAGDSRLEIVQPNSNEKTPNMMVNKNPLGQTSASKPPSSGLMLKPGGGKGGLFAKPKMTVKKKFQMDVVQDDKNNAIIDKIENKGLLKANNLKPSFTASSPMGVRKTEQREQSQNSYLGANLKEKKGM